MVNRKLIRPSLSDLREQQQQPQKYGNAQRKRIPPEQTNAEQYYYLKQMSSKTPMVIKLTDGEVIHGVIEWYDRYCIKVNRDTEPNLLIPKHQIKYMFKENEVKGSDENVMTSSEMEES
jgi:host factor-I protein